MNFICEDCGEEMDYDEGANEIVECGECGGNMFADQNSGTGHND